FFEGFDFAMSNGLNGHDAAVNGKPEVADSSQLSKEFAVYNLILAYRMKGHLVAKTNPIRPRKDRGANLDLKYFGLTDADLSQSFAAGQFIGLGTSATLKQIVDHLNKVYCEHIGVEYQYVVNQERLEWLQKEIETTLQQPLSLDQR